MKHRASRYVWWALLLLALGGGWLLYRWGTQAPVQVFQATVDRDCAPWDGSAFTVSVPFNNGQTLHISIYRSPDIRLPSSFSFPDETTSEGNAYLLMPDGPPEQLTGEVWLQRVSEEIPVQGRFQLRSEGGGQFEGKLFAEWGDEIVYCG